MNGFYKCLENYGTYIKSCWAKGDILEDLHLFSSYCPNLKSLDISLPDWGLDNTHDLVNLVSQLSAIVRETSLTKLTLCNVELSIDDGESGAETLLFALWEANVHTTLHKLEFGLGYLFSGGLPSLQQFHQLVELNCPIHVLTTATIDALAKSSLQKLYVTNYYQTQQLNFNENDNINWMLLGSAHPDLHVHYFVEERALELSDLCPNPLIRSFIIDSAAVYSRVILAIADHYGKTLQSFVFITGPYDDIETAQIFEMFLHECPHLHTFACGEFARVTEMMLRMYGSQFHELLVCANQIEFNQESDEDGFDEAEEGFGKSKEGVDYSRSLASLEEAVSAAMGRPWNAVEPGEFMDKVLGLMKFWDRPLRLIIWAPIQYKDIVLPV